MENATFRSHHTLPQPRSMSATVFLLGCTQGDNWSPRARESLNRTPANSVDDAAAFHRIPSSFWPTIRQLVFSGIPTRIVARTNKNRLSSCAIKSVKQANSIFQVRCFFNVHPRATTFDHISCKKSQVLPSGALLLRKYYPAVVYFARSRDGDL